MTGSIMNIEKGYRTAMKLITFFLCTTFLAIAPSTASELTPYHAAYEVLRDNSEYGEAQRLLKRNSDGLFELYTETEISWMFLSDRRRYWSTFEWHDAAIATREFSFKRSGSGRNKQFSASYQAKPPVLDEAAMLEQLRFDLFDSSRNEFRYAMIDDKGQTDQHLYHRADTETLQLPYGEVVATKVVRIREHSDRETYYWFAPDLANVLVKMQHIEDGDEVATLVLRKLAQPE
jgi:hypothetical protein